MRFCITMKYKITQQRDSVAQMRRGGESLLVPAVKSVKMRDKETHERFRALWTRLTRG